MSVLNLKLFLLQFNLQTKNMISSEKEKDLDDRLDALRGYL
jgi:hypothetical protein